MTETPAGVYLHVPFCARLCSYCDFYRVAGSSPEERARYVEALVTELERTASAGPRALTPAPHLRQEHGRAGDEVAAAGPRALTPTPHLRQQHGRARDEVGEADWPVFGSVFVGGGTPTLLESADLARIIRRVGEVLPLDPQAEVTVEANPETVDEAYFTALRDAGVTRVSMGAQSFAPHVLDELGRWHERDRPLEAVAAARRAGLPRVSLDLIYGAPSETADDWAATLDTALSADIDHVSAYALTVEPSTEYAARIRQGTALAPDDDVQADRMAATARRLSAAGFERYELSNWARPGSQCRHNLTYWRNGNWLGLGAGAHGHWDGRRQWNLRPPGRYADAVLAGATAVAGSEVVSDDQQRTERLLLGLRMAEGVRRSAVEPIDQTQLDALTAAGLVVADERLRLTSAGWALANDITVRLLA